MTFNKFYKEVKKKFASHQEIILECDRLAVQISDIFYNSFFIVWENDTISVELHHYTDNNVCISASQDHLERLFTERQYLFVGQDFMNIKGSFVDVMMFQKLLSFIAKDNTLVIQEEIIRNMLHKQDMISSDLGLVMQSLQLLLVNNIIDSTPSILLENNATPSKKSENDITGNKSTRRKKTSSATEKEVSGITGKTATSAKSMSSKKTTSKGTKKATASSSSQKKK